MEKLLYKENWWYTAIMIFICFCGLISFSAILLDIHFEYPFNLLPGIILFLTALFIVRKKINFFYFYETHLKVDYPYAKTNNSFLYKNFESIELFNSKGGKYISIYIKGSRKPLNIYYSHNLFNIIKGKAIEYNFQVK